MYEFEPYSTVTLLAKFRGLSTLQPRMTACVIGQQLEGDHAEERLQAFSRLRDVHHVIRLPADLHVAFGGDGDDLFPRGRELPRYWR